MESVVDYMYNGFTQHMHDDDVCQWERLSLLFITLGLILGISVYYTIKFIYATYRLLFHLYEYKPNHPHLRGSQARKMYGTVKRKNGMTTPNSDNIPPAVPNGWYYIMMSSELKREEVKHVSMCELELAVFRDAHGHVHALDAFCPHLGANLAIGGKVKGSCLECPFHSWKFNGADGKCVDIPGAKKIPDIARTKSWPIMEVNHVILLWHDAEDREPLFMPRELDEVYHDDWVIHARAEHIVHCHISEIPENGADVAHFIPVHNAIIVQGSNLAGINKSAESSARHEWSGASWYADKTEWFIARGTLRHDLAVLDTLIPYTGADVTFEQIGPAVVHLRPTVAVFGPLLIVQYVIPQEMFKQRVIHIAIGRKGLMGKLGAIFALRAEGTMVERDIMLWNNKKFNRQPVLASTKSDELLVKFRRWYSQFYSDNTKVSAKAADLSW